MNRHCFIQALQATLVTLTLAAVLQELEKPQEERRWHGKIAGLVPYDFRLPTLEILKEAYWNTQEHRVLTPRVFGIGWGINFHALLENLRMITQTDISEEDFLMPTESIKEILGQAETRIET